MDDAQAETLRARFNTLSDSYRFTVDDVDLIPAVLGRAIKPTSYSYSDPKQVSITVYDEKIHTAGDLRQLLKAHPRTKENDEEPNPWEPVAKALGEGIRNALIGPIREITELRIRFRVLYEMMQEKDAGFALEFAHRYWDKLEHDFEPISNQVRLMLNTPEQVKEFEEHYKDWLTDRESRDRKLLGPELADQLLREHNDWRQRMKDAEDSHK